MDGREGWKGKKKGMLPGGRIPVSFWNMGWPRVYLPVRCDECPRCNGRIQASTRSLVFIQGCPGVR